MAIHHPRGSNDVRPSLSLGHRGAGVQFQGCVVVYVAVLIHDPAVAVVGVLIHTEVRNQYDLIAKVFPEVAQRNLDDAVWVPCLGAFGVFVQRQAEQDYRRHAKTNQLLHLSPERVLRVLGNTGE